MQTVLITGGTGMIGTRLTKLLVDNGFSVIILTRKIPDQHPAAANISYALWNVSKQQIDPDAIRRASVIVHLAGAGVVDKKWSDAYKSEIIKSRTESSQLLIQALKNNSHNVKTVVSASAIGWYGEDPPPSIAGFVETDPAATGFLGETCRLWEQSIEPVESLDIRLAKIRTGIVLSNKGGALPEFKKSLTFGVAGILGSGKQVVSWIHLDDLCSIFINAIENPALSGAYNAVAPNPVTNKALTTALARQQKGSFYIPVHVPGFVLKLMLGQRSTEVLKSTTVSSEKIEKTGFTFLYPTIETALQELAGTGN